VSKTILVAEDGKATREMLALLLSNHGYAVIEVSNGKQAWDKVKAHLPDLVILDSEMPELSGGEVYRLMKRDPATKEIPILFLVAGPANELSTLSLPPPQFLISKPFKAHDLLARVEGALV
jgi:CheY-like chemotaxis protein